MPRLHGSKRDSRYLALTSILMLAGALAHAETIRHEGLSALQELRIAEGDRGEQHLLITDHAGALVLDTDKALPRIENAYSPHSYDGYMADLLAERQGKSTVIDLQGERHTLLSPVNKAGDYLLLTTREEGNGAYNFNLKFRYDSSAKSFDLTQILLNENDTQCDQSLLSSYAIDSKALGITSITDLDGALAFGALRALRLAHQTSSAVTAEKLMPETVASNFDAALKAYKAGNEQELKTLVGYFLAGDEDGACAPGNYVVEKYYFPQRVGWSNDLGFLFEQAGHYPEAVELLKHITRKHPDRVVAYLNLADAYWALDEREQAGEAYNQYYEKMLAAQKQSRIPPRVLERK
ncbi:tetratricopeptide repeat protein [Pseudomonas sp. NPDC077186]|uniref:tetratricopeptide repeat protein n=1 Tax=Pseudomonas sp. NPDC077186 TaxID=3364421 RepID=UPI0037CAC7EE